jgi:hypothetical protein
LPREPGTDTRPSDTPLEVTCESTGIFSCVLIETACSADADCAAGMSCINNPNRSCASSSDGQTICDDSGPDKTCAPMSFPGDPGTGSPTPDLQSAGTTSFDGIAEASAASDPVASGDGGCSLGGTPMSQTGLGLWSSFGGLLAFAFRRRHARSGRARG